MEDLIVYRIGSEAEQTFVLLVPANCGLAVEEIAVKDTPEGAPFWIVPRSEHDPNENNDFQTELSEIVKNKKPSGYGVQTTQLAL
ncbi:hypothetical protein ACGCE5_08740 [Kluyvera ascorbata]|uniref:hypothetical protein n=1 Tax=Kluyvera ascorbata TaxID=51288 RepID=UPI00374CEE4E